MNTVSPAIQRARVLIVDDSDDQRLLLRRYFERAGCVVEVADSAEEAIRLYEESVPDLAVIDLILPGIDGWELASLVKERHPGCAIAITSVLDPEDYPESQAILPKPVTGKAVRAVLRAWVPKWTEK